MWCTWENPLHARSSMPLLAAPGEPSTLGFGPSRYAITHHSIEQVQVVCRWAMYHQELAPAAKQPRRLCAFLSFSLRWGTGEPYLSLGL